MNMHDFQKFVLWAIPVLFAITLHEVAHGWVASKFGDKTAKMMGRLTLNPINHIDLVGTIIVPAIFIAIILVTKVGFIFGWAKPVPVTRQNLRNPKRDMAFVAVAGPAANLLMALFWACIMKIGFLISHGDPQAGLDWVLIEMGQAGILVNLVLMLLNIIPIPPLDGSRIVSSFLPNKADYYYSRLEPFGFILLVILLWLGILNQLLLPCLFFCFKLISQLFGLHF